jgi:hypothetical protein
MQGVRSLIITLIEITVDGIVTDFITILLLVMGKIANVVLQVSIQLAHITTC